MRIPPKGTPPQPAPQFSPVVQNERLGTVKVNWGLEQCESWWSTQEMKAGKPVGPGYYRTVKDAVADLTHRTWEDVGPAAVVLREGDYFTGRTLLSKTVKGYEIDHDQRWHTIDEKPEQRDIMDMRRDNIDPRVAAIVDGRFVHRFSHPDAPKPKES